MHGGCQGLTVMVIQLYNREGFDFKLPLAALQQMGFNVILYVPNALYSTLPSLDEFEKQLEECNQVWVISTNSNVIPPEYIASLAEANRKGVSLYLWGDNDPFNVAVNSVLEQVLPGATLHSSYNGTKKVRYYEGPFVTGQAGFAAHQIFTGIASLHEGVTIARFNGSHPRLKFIMNSSEGQPALGICEADDDSGRIAVDCGYTRLFPSNWDTAGTERFVKNIAGWLCNIDGDWVLSPHP
jgi:hypothetical protein